MVKGQYREREDETPRGRDWEWGEPGRKNSKELDEMNKTHDHPRNSRKETATKDAATLARLRNDIVTFTIIDDGF